MFSPLGAKEESDICPPSRSRGQAVADSRDVSAASLAVASAEEDDKVVHPCGNLS